MRLVLIGLVAGLFSSLFGVGGGIVIVPLLILVAAFGAREAAATSLGAIVITALAGVALYAVRGKVDVAYALLVGIPAMGGAMLGNVGAATALRPGPDGRVLRAPRGGRCLVADGMSTSTVVLAVVLGLGGRGDVGSLRCRRRDSLRADARRARPRAGRGGRDVAARRSADRRRR